MYPKLTTILLALSFSIACQAAETTTPATPAASAELPSPPPRSEGKADKARVDPHRPTSVHAPKPQG